MRGRMSKVLAVAALGIVVSQASAATVNVVPSTSTRFVSANGVVSSDSAPRIEYYYFSNSSFFQFSNIVSGFQASLPFGATVTSLTLTGTLAGSTQINDTVLQIFANPGDGSLQAEEALNPSGIAAPILLNNDDLDQPFTVNLPISALGADGQLEATFRIFPYPTVGNLAIQRNLSDLALTIEYDLSTVNPVPLPLASSAGLLALSSFIFVRRRSIS